MLPEGGREGTLTQGIFAEGVRGNERTHTEGVSGFEGTLAKGVRRHEGTPTRVSTQTGEMSGHASRRRGVPSVIL